MGPTPRHSPADTPNPTALKPDGQAVEPNMLTIPGRRASKAGGLAQVSFNEPANSTKQTKSEPRKPPAKMVTESEGRSNKLPDLKSPAINIQAASPKKPAKQAPAIPQQPQKTQPSDDRTTPTYTGARFN